MYKSLLEADYSRLVTLIDLQKTNRNSYGKMKVSKKFELCFRNKYIYIGSFNQSYGDYLYVK